MSQSKKKNERINLSDDREPWHQQPGESSLTYSRFQTFLELGPTRDLFQVREIMNATSVRQLKSVAQLRNDQYLGRWIERAQAFDNHELNKERARLVKRRTDMLNRHIKLAGGLHAKAIQALSSINASTLTPTEIARFVATAADLERKAIGEPERIAVTGATGGPVAVEDFSRYTPEERNARLADIAAELARRVTGMDTGADDEE